MQYKRLGKTNLMVSEIGFGGEWLERHPEEESVELVRYAHAQGINIIDCWMPDPVSITGAKDRIVLLDTQGVGFFT